MTISLTLRRPSMLVLRIRRMCWNSGEITRDCKVPPTRAREGPWAAEEQGKRGKRCPGGGHDDGRRNTQRAAGAVEHDEKP